MLLIVERFPELVHDFVKARFFDEAVRPKTVVKLRVRHCPGAILDQNLQQLHHLWAKWQRLIVSRQLAAIGIEREVIEADAHQQSVARQSGNDLEPPNALRAVDLEVASIDGEDSPEMLALSNAHQRGIGEIHRKVAILSHQLSHTKAIFLL